MTAANHRHSYEEIDTHTPIRCKRCTKEFIPKGIHHLYCSEWCKRGNTGAGKHWSKGIEYVPRRLCELCGTRFYAPPVLIRRGGGRFCSNRCRTKDLAMHPERYPQTTSRRGIGGRREDLDNRYFRSAWEANYARYLNFLVKHKQIAAWDYEVDTFEFPVKRGARFYTPDFKVTELSGKIVYHEVKGWMDKRSATQLRRMALHHPEIALIVIDAEAYRAIAYNAARLIPNWETVRNQFARSA